MNNHSTISITVAEEMEWMLYPHLVKDGRTVIHPYHEHQSIKDCVESIGIPHVEVSRYILGESEEVPETHIMNPYEQIMPLPQMPEPFRESTFVVDTHLGKLATYLRLFGFDAEYQPDLSHDELLKIREHGIILTRSRELLKHRDIRQAMFIRSTDPAEQVREVMYRYSLIDHYRYLYRCSNCNAILVCVEKELVEEYLEEETKKWIDSFFQCPACGKVYWYGSHYRNLEEIAASMQ